MSVLSFSEMAAIRPEDVKVVPLPRGTFRMEIFEPVAEPETTAKGYGVMFYVKARIVAPHDDFENPEDLAEYEKEMGDPVGTVRRLGFYVPTEENPDSKSTKSLQAQQREALNRLMKFFSNVCGMGSKTLDEYRVECVNSQFYMTVEWEKDPESQDEFREKTPDLRNLSAIDA